MSELPTFGVTDFVAVLNQTLEFSYPSVNVVGELANFRINKNRWVYFDLKDEFSSLKFFGSVHALPGPLEDGIMLEVRAQPRLHPNYGFSMNFISLVPVGEGSLKRAAALLEAKLRSEGLFAPERKRSLAYPPHKIGLIASAQSAAYHDFIKILNERWCGLEIELFDVAVQGQSAPEQIIQAVDYFDKLPKPADVLVITRGGGSPEDLAAFNHEQVARAVAASRTPTLVAIGHEIDISLAELVADLRASTPSNAAELLVPSKIEETAALVHHGQHLAQLIKEHSGSIKRYVELGSHKLSNSINNYLSRQNDYLHLRQSNLNALDPRAVLKRGYAIVRLDQLNLRSIKQVRPGQEITVQLSDGSLTAGIKKVNLK